MMMHDLYLYGRENCHLCDEMLSELEPLLQATGYKCHTVKVDGDPELEQRYGARVPVLVGSGGRELCQFKLDRKAVTTYISLGITGGKA